jgi:NADP-dependent 3-hydroxy acid dehydrogenase YdfG
VLLALCEHINSARALVEAATGAHRCLDVFINSAGVMLVEPLDEFKVDECKQMIDVNIMGVLDVTGREGCPALLAAYLLQR